MPTTPRTSTVYAFSPKTNSGRAVIQERDNDKPLVLLAKLDEPFTLSRCSRLMDLAKKMVGDVTSFTVRDFEKSKVYKYYDKQNRLVIFQDGLPIYENWNGTVCRDKVALADCLL